ncbi:MAG: hypothetical protein HYY13_04705 [Nitrospirae bacterium]|nr:hypothetical protein [Nitrospirota bacterium]
MRRSLLVSLALFSLSATLAHAHSIEMRLVSILPPERAECAANLTGCTIYTRPDGPSIDVRWSANHGKDVEAAYHIVLTGSCTDKARMLPGTSADSTPYSDADAVASFTINPADVREATRDLPGDLFTLRLCYSVRSHEDSTGTTTSSTTTTSGGTGQPAGSRFESEIDMTLRFDEEKPQAPPRPTVSGRHHTLLISWAPSVSSDIGQYRAYLDTRCHEQQPDARQALSDLTEGEVTPDDRARMDAALTCYEDASQSYLVTKEVDGSKTELTLTELEGEPLQNNRFFFVVVRAVDRAGNESASFVGEEAFGRPIPATGPQEVFGEPGCAAVPGLPGPPAALVYLMAPGVFVAVRKRAGKVGR